MESSFGEWRHVSHLEYHHGCQLFQERGLLLFKACLLCMCILGGLTPLDPKLDSVCFFEVCFLKLVHDFQLFLDPLFLLRKKQF